jgi:hypothetical protein
VGGGSEDGGEQSEGECFFHVTITSLFSSLQI